MAELTPMMQKYVETKKEYKDCILFYRLGDFYEMFFEDAKIVSKELELTLTGKDCGLEERAPMCGVPYHAAEVYISRLIERGYKVAVCDQVEDPKTAKGLVKREVTRIVTPGTNMNAQTLDETKHNYLMCLIEREGQFAFSVADISTGDFYVAEVENARKLFDEVVRIEPSELITSEDFPLKAVGMTEWRERTGTPVYTLEERYFSFSTCETLLVEQFCKDDIKELGLPEKPLVILAGGAILQYLQETQKMALSNLTGIRTLVSGTYMVLDSSSRRNLELCETMREKKKRGSLLWVLDKTKTAMGARMLRSFVEQPLLKPDEIVRRQDAVEELFESEILREELREYMSSVYDLERLISRISYHSASPRDLIALKNSLSILPAIRYLLKDCIGELLQEIYDQIDPLEDMCSYIDSAICEDPPLTIKEGGIIREGFQPEIDRLRSAKTDGKQWLAKIETDEREKTGIKNLKIKFNKVFGYYLEVTNSYKHLVPEYYTRKQTLTNAERYITPELKELEDVILGAEEKLFSMEYDLFIEVRDRIGQEVYRIQKTARAIAILDAIASLALVARRNQYIRPCINSGGVINIRSGRHPVVEKMISNDMFIPNDVYLDQKKERVAIITGPNMAGKSTYMRQVALIVLMAQMGSFVPAAAADIGVVDRIFTRVGASDDLASGQSTFMVEMTEVANILKNATPSSLVILDEIGRGTSTFDGLSIAWSVVEYICNARTIGAKTLFATHYHELTELEGKIPGVNNYCIAVRENGEDIIFLRKIIRGGADKSYGIQVAKLAGVPEPVLKRAREIMAELLESDIHDKARGILPSAEKKKNRKKAVRYDEVDSGQMVLNGVISAEDIVKELMGANISTLTPLEAMNLIYHLQSKWTNRWQKDQS